jgi:hypothetical protein
MLLLLNGTHGVGKTATAALVQQLNPNPRVFDAEKFGETLMDVHLRHPRWESSRTGHRGGRSQLRRIAGSSATPVALS